MKGHRFFAVFYDLCSRLSQKQLAPMRKFAAGGASGKVLEIGCGTGGNFAFYDWSKVESLDATEPDPFMMRRARSKTAAAAAEGKVSLHEAPAEALPFPDASFDTVVSTLVLCTVQNPARAAAEIRRVLKSEGSLRLVEHVRAQGGWARFQDFVQPALSYRVRDGRNTELTAAMASGWRCKIGRVRAAHAGPRGGRSSYLDVC
jgi:ubiquinone/menaquinone biosynthesis C-methylase UbiE